jgi:hypothetical protein
MAMFVAGGREGLEVDPVGEGRVLLFLLDGIRWSSYWSKQTQSS